MGTPRHSVLCGPHDVAVPRGFYALPSVRGTVILRVAFVTAIHLGSSGSEQDPVQWSVVHVGDASFDCLTEDAADLMTLIHLQQESR